MVKDVSFTSAELDALLICIFHMFARMKADEKEPAEIYHTVLKKVIALHKRSKAQ